MHLHLPLGLTTFTCLALASTACVAKSITVYGRLALADAWPRR
jgi:hypothetical protein